MKNLISTFLLLAIVLFLFISCEDISKVCFAKGLSSINFDYIYDERKRIDIGNGIGCIFDIKTSEVVDIGSEKIKKIETKGEFFDKTTNKTLMVNKLSVIFTFNGEKAYIKNQDTDIVKSEKGIAKGWNILGNNQFFASDDQCVVSGTWGIFNRSGLIKKSWNHNDNFHIDLICYRDGEVEYNIKAMHDINGKICLKKNVSDKTTTLSDKLKRHEVVTDYMYIYNEGDSSIKDVYKYVTRQIEISYIDEEENVISSTVVGGNFRYNLAKEEAVCLSTYDGGDSETVKGSAILFMRTGNEVKGKGGAYGEIKLKHDLGAFSDNYTETIIIKCNKMGKLSNKIIDM